jgi:hypothetical protein
MSQAEDAAARAGAATITSTMAVSTRCARWQQPRGESTSAGASGAGVRRSPTLTASVARGMGTGDPGIDAGRYPVGYITGGARELYPHDRRFISFTLMRALRLARASSSCSSSDASESASDTRRGGCGFATLTSCP